MARSWQAYQILAKILCRKRAAIHAGDISSHDDSKSDRDSDYNPETSSSAISLSFNRKEQSCSYTVNTRVKELTFLQVSLNWFLYVGCLVRNQAV